MKKDKKQDKKMTTGRVYLRTLGLVTGRWVFSVFGLIAFAIVVVIGLLFEIFVWGLNEESIISVTLLFALAGFVVYFIISKIGKTAYRNAQITEISYAFQNNKFIDKDINPLDILNNRFEVATLFPMVIRSIDLLFIMVAHHKDKEFVAKMKNEWKKSLEDFIACFLTGIVPILGFCSLSWFLQNPEDGVFKGACDGLYGIFINKKKLIKRMLFVFFIELIIVVVIIFAIYAAIVITVAKYQLANEMLTSFGETYEFHGSTAFYVGALILAFLIFKFIPWLYIQSYGMISVLQIYTKATTENPPGTSPLYTKIINKYNDYKQKNDEENDVKDSN